MADFACDAQDNCVCPYCGDVDEDSWELGHESGENTCGSCERTYRYTRDVTVTYSTEKTK